MQSAFLSGASASPPTMPVAPSLGFPAPGNPGVSLATKPGAWWYHMVTQELLAVVSAAGLTPDQANLSQVLAAIRTLAVGRLVNVQVFNASGTYTPSSSRISKIVVEAVGGGGAGGGAAATSSSSSAGGGGGAGCYIKAMFTGQPAPTVVTVGAGGAGASGAAGGAGGTTSFGALASVAGGGGGSAAPASTVFPVNAPPSAGGGTASSTGLVISTSPGGSGQWGIVYSLGANALGGSGGTSVLGMGATWTGSGSTGNAGIGKGAGGSGACNATTGGALLGGAGAAGAVIVYEYE